MSLQDLCIRSATRYLQFLEANKLGLVEISVTEKRPLEGELWHLVLGRRLFDEDAVQLWVRGQTYETQEDGHFTVESYDDEARVLVIKLRRTIPGFMEADNDQVRIISNLRFLVERVRQWFIANGHECKFPERNEAGVVPPMLDLGKPDQLAAYEAALTLPCCYIWGPPGTGKTRYVLTSAAIARVLQGRRVAIIAPTNLAVDLAMTSILEACDRLRDEGRLTSTQSTVLARANFLRLGTPSAEFAGRFPEVCEDHALNRRIVRLQARVDRLSKLIRYKRNRSCLPVIEQALDRLNEAESSLLQLNSAAEPLAAAEARKKSIEDDLDSHWARLTGWLSGNAERKAKELAECGRKISELGQQVFNAESAFSNALKPVGSLVVGSQLLDDIFEKVSKIRAPVRDKDARLETAYLLIVYSRRLSEIHANISNLVLEDEAVAPLDENRSLPELEQELASVQAEMESLRRPDTKTRLLNVRVIGCTLDRFISEFRDEAVPADHIFLDEASYTPVIKALTLFRRNIPVTLLGDHKQLPPICEMKDKWMQQEDWPCVLWARSALFAKHLLGDPLPPIRSLFDNLEEPPPSGQLPRSVLTCTYRFGQNLASLLDELFYGIGFTSVVGSNAAVVIKVVSARRMGSDWVNENECAAVCEWIDGHGGKGTAVLSPYRKQVARLVQALSRELQEDVLTVARAQGREWETVVFSAADTMRTPFLTDIMIPQGKLVMNTAISRTKRVIVIVCDVDYWSRRDDRKHQLLSRLIQLAR